MSGTTDPVVLKRIAILQSIKASLNDIINKVQNGQMREADIPITQAAYDRFLPALQSSSSPLPQLISNGGMSDALNSLFPIFNQGDMSGANLARDLFGKYAGNLFKNISWDLNVTSTSDADERIARELLKGAGMNNDNMHHGGTGPRGGVWNNDEGDIGTMPSGKGHGAPPAGGAMWGQDEDHGYIGKGPHHKSMPSGAPPKHAPVKLDWKERSRQICEQVSRRGMDPYEFGCMQNPDKAGENFSFRGYAKMICSRLGTNYDPGVPELCGCPPPSWPGWRP
jgi:hypothetical protein